MDMIKYIEDYIDKKAKINYMDMQPGDVKETYADIDYSRKKLGFKPSTSIKDGIPQFIEWYKFYNNLT